MVWPRQSSNKPRWINPRRAAPKTPAHLAGVCFSDFRLGLDFRLRLGRGCGGVFNSLSNSASRRCSFNCDLTGAVMASRNRGKKKLKLRDLSRLHPTYEERLKLWDQIGKRQPPIVTAIIGQALLENELDQLLRPHFTRRDDETWAKLTNEIGPLATFNAKIITAHAFGICNDVVRDGLNTVRQIRNAFAHSKKPLDFSHELIIREIKVVTLPAGKRTQLYKSLSDVRDTATESQGGAQGSYVMLCLAIETELLKTQTRRHKAKGRRLSKRLYSQQLAGALSGFQPEQSASFLRGLLQSQNADPSLPTPPPSQKKPNR